MTTSGIKRGFAGKLFSRLLHTYFLMARGMTLGVRAIVRSGDGKFLMVRHTYTLGWHFPGGGVETGEASDEALRKELLQETGLKLLGKPALHGVFYNNGVSKRDHVLAFLCEVEGTLACRPTSLEIAEVGYFDIDNLPANTDPGTVRRMREIVYGNMPGQTW